MTLEDRLQELLNQAENERSHYYTAALLRETIAELERLREFEFMYQSLCD